jgi:biotin carboxylase
VTRLLVLHPRLADVRGADLERYRPLLRMLGLRLVLADHRPDPALTHFFEEVVELPPPEEVEAGWRVLEGLFARRTIDAVWAQTESGLPYGALVAQALGVRGPSPRAAYLCLDKHACRVRLAEAGVSQPPFRLAHDLAQARRAATEIGFPLVLKGCASANQRLVTLVRTPDELAASVARLQAGLRESRDIVRLLRFAAVARFELADDPRSAFLVEGFADGDPLESDGLVIGERVLSFGVTEQIHARVPEFFIEGYLTPADRPPEELERLESLTNAALAALGLRDSGYSIEFRSSASASRVIEVNGRLGCDEGFGDLFETVIGAQPVYLAMRAALGWKVRFERTPGRAALAYRSVYSAGRILSVPEATERARLAREGLTLGLNVRPGQILHDAHDAACHPHLAFVLARDPRSSRVAFERASRAAAALPFELEFAPGARAAKALERVATP